MWAAKIDLGNLRDQVRIAPQHHESINGAVHGESRGHADADRFGMDQLVDLGVEFLEMDFDMALLESFKVCCDRGGLCHVRRREPGQQSAPGHHAFLDRRHVLDQERIALQHGEIFQIVFQALRQERYVRVFNVERRMGRFRCDGHGQE